MPRRVHGPGRAEDARAVAPGQPFELRVGIGLVRDDAETAVGDPDEELADRRLDHVVGDVEQALLCGRGTEALVELRRNAGHGCLLLSRRRRTPEEAAGRAASSEEPSAAAISS